MSEHETMTLAETARWMGCSERTLRRRRARAGETAPRAERRGRRKLLARRDVEAWAGPHLAEVGAAPARADGLTGRPGPLLTPGSPEWMAVMTASKVASVVRLSPYQSRVDLWLRMHGDLPEVEQTDVMARGLFLEGAIADWWADQHPDAVVERTGTWYHRDHPWLAASPDRLVRQADGTTALLEIKSAAADDEWGRGLDDVPIGYATQVQHQMHVTGARWCWVAVLLPRLEFREYLLEYDPAVGAALERACRAFLDDLAEHRRPELDGDESTYLAMRAVHPEIDDEDVEVGDELADRYLAARVGLKAAETEARLAGALVLDALGRARRAVRDGQPIATRQPNGEHPPKLVANAAAVKAAS